MKKDDKIEELKEGSLRFITRTYYDEFGEHIIITVDSIKNDVWFESSFSYKKTDKIKDLLPLISKSVNSIIRKLKL